MRKQTNGKMKKIKYILGCIGTALMFSACSDFLDVATQNGLDPDQANDAERFCNAAYASLMNQRDVKLWAWGDVRSDDAYKGGGGTNDGYTEHCYETGTHIVTTFNEPDGYWFAQYCGISRVNTVLNALNLVSEKEFPNKVTRQAEMRFLRGHFYFLLKILFKNIPFVDETVPEHQYQYISNVALTDVEMWDKIIEDFKFAFDNLPEKQADLGRANKYAAAAYLAKANLYKAYRQNEKYEVTSIDAGDLEEVVKYTGEVLKSSYGLETDFAYNFMPEFENGKESIFAIQFSKDDGTMFGNLNFADFLSVPQGLGCCDFHKPSQNLVNAFKTSKGLPMFKMTNGVYSENYDIANYSKSKAADPRLFSTVAMDGFPYKYNEDLLFQNSWNRNPEVYGNFASLKENVDPSCDCFVNLSPYYANSMNKILIRFADVLLMRAEALIELNRESEALPLINQIRQRAQDSANGMVNYSDPDLKPVMEVALYQDGSNCVWNQEFARYALRWERRLEFAMENMRFFDLVRWGICSETMNKYFQSEKARRSYLKEAVFTKNKNEYAPIPQQQIGYSKDVYKQNYGWK